MPSLNQLSRIIKWIVKLSGQYWNRPDSIKTVRTELKTSRQYWNRPDSIETIQTVSKPSGQFWNRPDSIETVRTVLKPSGQYCKRPDSIKTVWTISILFILSELSGKFYYPLLYVARGKLRAFSSVATGDLRTFLYVARSLFTRFVRKVFARKKLLSGKF